MKLVIATFAAIMLVLYGGVFQKEWALYAGCCPVVLITIFFALYPSSASRKRAEDDLQQTEKELGFRPYTQAELDQMELEDRDHHNREESAGAWWGGSDTYIDYDGNIRKVNTGEITGFAYLRKRG